MYASRRTARRPVKQKQASAGTSASRYSHKRKSPSYIFLSSLLHPLSFAVRSRARQDLLCNDVQEL